jgi:hypothetical protein
MPFKLIQSLAMRLRRRFVRFGGLSMRSFANRPLHACRSMAQGI